MCTKLGSTKIVFMDRCVLMFRDVMKEKKTDDMKEKISWKVESAH